MHRPGVEPATSRSQLRRPNHYTIEPPDHTVMPVTICYNSGSNNTTATEIATASVADTEAIPCRWLYAPDTSTNTPPVTV